MTSLPHPFRPVSLSAGDEALELLDIGASDVMPEQDVDAFPPDEYPSDEDYARMEAHNAALKAQAEGDDEPTPPSGGGGAVKPNTYCFDASAARFSDDELIMAIYVGDAEPHRLALDGQRDEWLSAMTAEVLRRLDARKANTAA